MRRWKTFALLATLMPLAAACDTGVPEALPEPVVVEARAVEGASGKVSMRIEMNRRPAPGETVTLQSYDLAGNLVRSDTMTIPVISPELLAAEIARIEASGQTVEELLAAEIASVEAAMAEIRR